MQPPSMLLGAIYISAAFPAFGVSGFLLIVGAYK